MYNIGYDDRKSEDKENHIPQSQLDLYNALPDFPKDNRMQCRWCTYSTDKCSFAETQSGLYFLNWICYRCGGKTLSKTANAHYKES